MVGLQVGLIGNRPGIGGNDFVQGGHWISSRSCQETLQPPAGSWTRLTSRTPGAFSRLASAFSAEGRLGKLISHFRQGRWSVFLSRGPVRPDWVPKDMGKLLFMCGGFSFYNSSIALIGAPASDMRRAIRWALVRAIDSRRVLSSSDIFLPSTAGVRAKMIFTAASAAWSRASLWTLGQRTGLVMAAGSALCHSSKPVSRA